MADKKITYIADGEVVRTIEMEIGAPVKPIDAPEKEGFDFVKWNNLPEVMPDEDIDAVAVYEADHFTLTEIVDEEVYQTLELQSGTDLTTLPLPEKEGATFSGWVKKYKKMPKSNLTLRGSFRMNKFKLTFEIDGMVFERTVNYGEPLDYVAIPERDHYTFSGWGKIPDTMPDRDLYFKGAFKLNTHTLTYILDGKEYKVEKYAYGDMIRPVSVPQKPKITFGGWRGIPKTMPDEDVVIEGKYYSKKFKVNFMVDGQRFTWVSLYEGETILPPEDPIKPGYRFISWESLPDVMPATDLSVEAVFEATEE